MAMGLLRKLANAPVRLWRMLVHPLQARRSQRARTAFFRAIAGPDDLVFDVGANVGDWAESFLANGNRVVAVEPQADCLAALRRRFGERITVVPQGVGAQVETRQLHIANESTISSFSTEWIEAVQATRFHDYTWGQTQEIELTTLDHLIEQHGRPVFIKIDVEGFELDVLQGLTQPVGYLSFEYTVPERQQALRDCVETLARLDPRYRFNYLSGPGPAGFQLRLPQGLEAAAFLRHTEGAEFQATRGGDVHVRLQG